MRSKYRNRKTVIDGITFDSQAEADRYTLLKLAELRGYIRNLRLQVPYVLIKGERWSDGRKHRDTVYKADFVYEDPETGKEVVEDVKGFRTKEYRIKRELMKAVHGIEIREIGR